MRLADWVTLCACLPGVAASGAALEAQSDSYRVVDVAAGGSLQGRVTFSGDAPRPARLLITKDTEVCGTGYRERQDVAVGDDGGLGGVVVYLEDVDAGKEWSRPDDGYVLDQVDCYFEPKIQVVPRGDTLAILNSDPVLHNVHAYELVGTRRRSLFNFGQPPERQRIDQTIRTRRGNLVGLECDAHDFMVGWIFAARNPYYAVTGSDGSFEIGDIPPGSYTVTALHPTLGMLEAEVSITADGDTTLNLEFERAG